MQVAIDGIKRQYAVDPNDEIARIRVMDCMKREKDYPLFMEYTHKIPVTKNGTERPYEEIKKDKKKIKKRIDRGIVCPMNYLQNWLDKIQGAVKCDTVDTYEYFVKMKGKADFRQLSKIRELIEDYDAFVRRSMAYSEGNDEYSEAVITKTKELIDIISRMKLSAITINRLIEVSLGVMSRTHTDVQYKNASKYMIQTFSILHRMNREKFLNNFIRGAQ